MILLFSYVFMFNFYKVEKYVLLQLVKYIKYKQSIQSFICLYNVQEKELVNYF